MAVAAACAGTLMHLCACSPTTVESPDPGVAPEPEAWPAPPPDSELARVRTGMSQQDVMAVLGPPSRITNETTLGPDEGRRPPTERTYYVYEGLGEVVFSSAAGGATAALGVYPERPTTP